MDDRTVYQKQDASYDYAVWEDCDAKRVCDTVWERYKGKSSSYMVEITHTDKALHGVQFIKKVKILRFLIATLNFITQRY